MYLIYKHNLCSKAHIDLGKSLFNATWKCCGLLGYHEVFRNILFYFILFIHCGLFYFILKFLAVSGLICGTWDLSLRRMGFSLVAACGFSLSSCSAQAPEHVSSVVVALRLSCPAACGILVPGPGIEPRLIGRGIVYHWTTREVPILFYVSLFSLRLRWEQMMVNLDEQIGTSD